MKVEIINKKIITLTKKEKDTIKEAYALLDRIRDEITPVLCYYPDLEEVSEWILEFSDCHDNIEFIITI